MPRISLAKAKRWLTVVWFLGALLLFALLFGQSVTGRYGDKSEEAWAWFASIVLPTLSLMIGIIVSDSLSSTSNPETTDRFVFKISFWLSIFYLAIAALTVLVRPLGDLTPLGVLRISNLWLAPLQGLVVASLGAFFKKKED